MMTKKCNMTSVDRTKDKIHKTCRHYYYHHFTAIIQEKVFLYNGCKRW